jgi:Contact-dependent growth inhibition CdiA C-terminal domain
MVDGAYGAISKAGNQVGGLMMTVGGIAIEFVPGKSCVDLAFEGLSWGDGFSCAVDAVPVGGKIVKGATLFKKVVAAKKGLSVANKASDALAVLNKAEDVAKPGVKIVGKTASDIRAFSTAEESTANYLRQLGRKVEPNQLEGAVGAGRQGDAWVDGVKHEFKNLDTGATSETVRNSVRRSVAGAGQARNIVIDARGSGLSFSDAQRGIARVRGAYGAKLDNLTIIGDDYFVNGVMG